MTDYFLLPVEAFTKGQPNTHKWDKEEIVALTDVAKTNKAIVSIIWQIPNQPLLMGLTEDELISLHSIIFKTTVIIPGHCFSQ